MILLVVALSLLVGLLLGKVYLFHHKLARLEDRLVDLEMARPVRQHLDPERWMGTFQQDR